MSIFERLGIKRKNKIGFSCGKLFIINYFRGYEILIIIWKILRFNIDLYLGDSNVCTSLNENHSNGIGKDNYEKFRNFKYEIRQDKLKYINALNSCISCNY